MPAWSGRTVLDQGGRRRLCGKSSRKDRACHNATDARHTTNCEDIMNIAHRAEAYNDAFPNRPGLLADAGMVVGTWMIGACYKNPNPLYGAYPHGYLERVHAMFPDAFRVLHVFSGGLTLEHAKAATGHYYSNGNALQGLPETELVDMHGPDEGRYPTWQGDLHEMPEEWNGRFDLVLADPPYSAADAVTYDCPAPNRAKIMRSLARVTATAGNLVWLDQVWPMHRKAEWKTWGTVGLLRSTNHRVRMVSFFERQPRITQDA